MARTATRTRTYTYVGMIGEELAKTDDKFRAAAEKMKEIAELCRDEAAMRGVRFKEVNDLAALQEAKFQWEEIVPVFLPENQRYKVKEVFDMLPYEQKSWRELQGEFPKMK